MKVEPVVLEGTHIRLEPLTEHHAAGVLAAAAFPEIFKWISFSLGSDEELRRFMRGSAKMREAGTALPFAIISRATGAPIGGTGYWHIESRHRRLEIGGSWLTPQWQRTAANTEAKYLLLRHAFETLECIRVEFVTDVLNEKSRAALKRLGAVEEGVLRNHMIQPDGRKRHSVCYSIIAEEWLQVKLRLEERLSAHAGARQGAVHIRSRSKNAHR